MHADERRWERRLSIRVHLRLSAVNPVTLLPQHLQHDEDEDGATEAAAQEQVQKRPPGRREGKKSKCGNHDRVLSVGPENSLDPQKGFANAVPDFSASS